MLTKKLYTLMCGALLLTSSAFANTKHHDKGDYSGIMKSIPKCSLTFNVDSATLSDGDRARLRELVSSARAKGEIDQVTIASWSDKPFPRAGMKLADADRDLADKRNDAVKTFLKDDLAVGDVDTYNMAEDSNWLARTFNTDDAELKSVFGRKGAATPVTNAEFQVIRNEGGASKSALVVEYKRK